MKCFRIIRFNILPVMFFISIGLMSCAQTKFTVSGHAYQVQDYCGGMEPTSDNLKQQQTPMPLVGKKLFVKSGTLNSTSKRILASASTDSTGGFSFKLPKGVYCIVDDIKATTLILPNPTQTTLPDTLCLKNQHEKCDLIIQVFDYDLKNQNVTYFKHCRWSEPCMQYSGPVPPSMEKNKNK